MIRSFRTCFIMVAAVGVLCAQDHTEADRKSDARLANATMAVREIMHSPDRGIPHDLLEKAQCVVVIPDLLKAAFVVGGQYGRGYATCRHNVGWTAPAAVRMEGGSFGFQLGGSSTDLIMLVMNPRGMDRLLGDKFTLGGEASAAAGPVGRETSADTDLAMHAEILTWSRSRGVFAGISLAGATLRPDKSEDRTLYGRDISNREILAGEISAPPATRQFVAEVSRFSRPMNGMNSAEARRRYTDHPPARNDGAARAMLSDNPIPFASGETSVPRDAEPVLARVAQTLRDNPGWKIRIEGFTDNTGNKFENHKVSRERADAVMNWLADHGVDRNRMSAIGRGEAHPVGDNSTDAGRAENRRVEIVRADRMANPTGI